MGCDPQFQKLYQIEIKRLSLVVGTIFIVILVFQSSSLPHGNALLSLLSFNSVMVAQSTLVHDSNSTDSSVVLGVLNYTGGINVSKEIKQERERKEKEKDPDNDSDPEEDQTSKIESYVGESVVLDKNSMVENSEYPGNSSALEKFREPAQGFPLKRVNESDNEDSSLRLRHVSKSGFVSQPLASSTVAVATNMAFLSESDGNLNRSDISANRQISSKGKEAAETVPKVKSPSPLRIRLVNLTKNSTITTDTVAKMKRTRPPTSISEMSSLLVQSRVSSHSMRPRWSSARDQELLSVKSQIEHAPLVKSDPELYAPLYRNISMFKRSYDLMEQMLKVYIYKEGEKPIFHQPKLKGIYASEGWFMKLMEGNKQFVVQDPGKAHMFYMPFSLYMLRLTLFAHDSPHHKDLAGFLKNYVNMIAGKYRFWNRTGGADHFLVACHDWAPQETIKPMGNCVRALCNTNVARDFRIGKDVSLPVTYVRIAEEPLKSLGGKPPSKRPILAFFAGGMHGYLRPILLRYWGNKDPVMKIFGPLPSSSSEKMNYAQYMKSSKYCICARGYEVHTPRVVEAIFYDCVPVIISDNYVPPFFEILNWEAFSVFILEKDVPNLKNILLSIPKKKYLEMQKRVKKVQKHFLWHTNPVKHDIFHMTLHSIWYNRVFQIKPR